MITSQLSSREKKILKTLIKGARIKPNRRGNFILIMGKNRFELEQTAVNSLIGKAFIKDSPDMKYLELTDKGKQEIGRIEVNDE